MATSERTIPSLDGLRGIAVLLVVFAHVGLFGSAAHFLLKRHFPWAAMLFQIDGGDLGVSVFFVISGFLITTLLIRQTDADGRVSLKDFYLRRLFRIFPPYYFYLMVVGAMWLAHWVPMLPGAFFSAATYTSNYYPYLWSQPSGQGWLVGHSWSLSLEEQFYLAWPGCLYFLRRKRAFGLGVVLLALTPVSRVVTLHLFPGTGYLGQIDRMFHTRIDTIMAGCVLALAGSVPGLYRGLVRAVNARWTGVLAGGLLFLTLHANWKSTGFQSIGLGVEALLLAFLLLYCITNANTVGGRLLNHPVLRHLGVISYGLYLWQQLFDGPVDLLRGHWMLIPVAILGAAEFSYFVVERASYRVRDRVLRRRAPALGTTGVV